MQEQIDEFSEREISTRAMYDNIINTINDQESATVSDFNLPTFRMTWLESIASRNIWT